MQPFDLRVTSLAFLLDAAAMTGGGSLASGAIDGAAGGVAGKATGLGTTDGAVIGG